MEVRYSYVLDSRAQIEYEDAIIWYASRSKMAAIKFADSVDEGLERITSNPFSFKKIYKEFYSLELKKYPFSIIYFVDDFIIVIVSIFHQKRAPENKFNN